MTSYTAERGAELRETYKRILAQVNDAASAANLEVTLVAVSKLKPALDIQALYDAGVRHFGENYPNELVQKAEELPKDIKWHFIGALQLGNVNTLVKKIDNLYAIETVDLLKKAKKANNTRKEMGAAKIKVFLQYNTSGEAQKAGFGLVDEVAECAQWLLLEEALALELEGLMTIGSFAESTSDEENKDFATLVDVKKQLDEKLGTSLTLSMGMSHDYVTAIGQGSTNVRVGSSIFGARPPKN